MANAPISDCTNVSPIFKGVRVKTSFFYHGRPWFARHHQPVVSSPPFEGSGITVGSGHQCAQVNATGPKKGGWPIKESAVCIKQIEIPRVFFFLYITIYFCCVLSSGTQWCKDSEMSSVLVDFARSDRSIILWNSLSVWSDSKQSFCVICLIVRIPFFFVAVVSLVSVLCIFAWKEKCFLQSGVSSGRNLTRVRTIVDQRLPLTRQTCTYLASCTLNWSCAGNFLCFTFAKLVSSNFITSA